MIAIIFLTLAGLTGAGFLVVVWRRRQMPTLLRGILIIAAAAVVLYVTWALAALFRAGG